MALGMENTSWNFTDSREWVDHHNSWPPVIISCAITGSIQGKEANPNLPMTPEEQAQSTYEAYKAGAAVVHVHARDPRTNYLQGKSARAEDFYKVNKLIRERCPDIIICDTGSTGFDLKTQEEMNNHWKVMNAELSSVDPGPMWGFFQTKMPRERGQQLQKKINEGSMDLDGSYDPETGMANIESGHILGFERSVRICRAMKAANTKPEIEVFSSVTIWFVDYMIKQGVIDPPYWCQVVFGQEGACNLPSPMNVIEVMRDMPRKSICSAMATGSLQIPIITQSLILGGHIRVGMEDNVYYRRGEKLQSNAQMVERVVRLSHEIGREVATPAEARQMLGISATPKQYP